MLTVGCGQNLTWVKFGHIAKMGSTFRRATRVLETESEPLDERCTGVELGERLWRAYPFATRRNRRKRVCLWAAGSRRVPPEFEKMGVAGDTRWRL